MRRSTASALMAGLMVSSLCRAGDGAFRERPAGEERPDERRHHRVARAGGVAHLRFADGRCVHFAALCGEHTVAAEGEEHALDTLVKQCLRGLTQALAVRDLHTGEQLCFDAVGLERVHAGKKPPELFCLDGGDGVDENGRGAVLGQVRDGSSRQICVDDHSSRAVEKIELRDKIVWCQLFADLHVGHGDGHIAVAAADENVGRGAPVGHAQGMREVDAEFSAALLDLQSARVAAYGGEKIGWHAEQAHVVCNVAPHAAETQLDTSGVGVPVAQGSEGMSADVDICAAADDGVGKIVFVVHGRESLEIICGTGAWIHTSARS